VRLWPKYAPNSNQACECSYGRAYVALGRPQSLVTMALRASICPSENRFFTSDLLKPWDRTRISNATQNRGDAAGGAGHKRRQHVSTRWCCESSCANL